MWSIERLGVLSKLPWRFDGVVGRKLQQGASHLMCNVLLQPWLEMVCGHRRDIFSGPIEACPLSCVLVVRANRTCIPVLSASHTCWWHFPDRKVQGHLDDGCCCWSWGLDSTHGICFGRGREQWMVVMVHAASTCTSAWPISHYMFDLRPSLRAS